LLQFNFLLFRAFFFPFQAFYFLQERRIHGRFNCVGTDWFWNAPLPICQRGVPVPPHPEENANDRNRERG
jgi:hypothetical protein